MAAQSAKDVHERHLFFPGSIHNKISQPIPHSFLSSHSPRHPLANEGLLISRLRRGPGVKRETYGFPSLPKTTPFGNNGLRFPSSSPSLSLRGGSAWVEEPFAFAAKNFSIFEFDF